MKATTKHLRRVIYIMGYPWLYILHKLLLTPLNRLRNASHANRNLEIGPGSSRIATFETLNVVAGFKIDYVCNAKRLPFKDETFDLIYASHILEHIPWYQVLDTLTDWVRTLKQGGTIEIWVPDGLKIASAFVAAEQGLPDDIAKDGWYRFNSERDPCVWANGRVFSYGDGNGKKKSPNWHMALFSPRYLKQLMERAGLIDVRRLDSHEVRGYDHGWINLGFKGKRP